MTKEKNNEIRIEASWKKELQPLIETEWFQELTEKIRKEYLTKAVFPRPQDVFRAFELTPFDKVRVVILGQDPYHGHGQAHGLCFSVPEGVVPPPSLKNIFKEIASDVETKAEPTPANRNGDLTCWAEQGVFLLNSILTVVQAQPTSHKDTGWEHFTDGVIQTLSDKRENIVFLLWGAYAQGKRKYIDESKHLVLAAPHPSPLSAHNGFFGCKHFSKANEYLKEHGFEPISW